MSLSIPLVFSIKFLIRGFGKSLSRASTAVPVKPHRAHPSYSHECVISTSFRGFAMTKDVLGSLTSYLLDIRSLSIVKAYEVDLSQVAESPRKCDSIMLIGRDDAQSLRRSQMLLAEKPCNCQKMLGLRDEDTCGVCIYMTFDVCAIMSSSTTQNQFHLLISISQNDTRIRSQRQ